MELSPRKRMEQFAAHYGLTLEQWSPGDGWTRYRFHAKRKGRDYYQEISHYMKFSEAQEWLEGYMTAKDFETD